MADFLVDEANEGGGPDNITVVVIRLEAGEKPA
jgi:serine/threonine protein phosphatase PrpC